jgi:hypothetical protein
MENRAKVLKQATAAQRANTGQLPHHSQVPRAISATITPAAPSRVPSTGSTTVGSRHNS